MTDPIPERRAHVEARAMGRRVQEYLDRFVPKRRTSAVILFCVAAVAVPAAGGVFPVVFDVWGLTAGFVALGASLLIAAVCLVLALVAVRRARQYGWNDPPEA